MSSVFNHPYAFTLGLYLPPRGEYEMAVTIANIVGWIPIIGSILGALRLGVGVYKYNSEKADKNRQADLDASKGMMARGVAEIFGCGPLLLFVDIIFTVGRARSTPRSV